MGTNGDIDTFGDVGPGIDFSLKNKKRVGVRNAVIIRKNFQFYKEFYN